MARVRRQYNTVPWRHGVRFWSYNTRPRRPRQVRERCSIVRSDHESRPRRKAFGCTMDPKVDSNTRCFSDQKLQRFKPGSLRFHRNLLRTKVGTGSSVKSERVPSASKRSTSGKRTSEKEFEILANSAFSSIKTIKQGVSEGSCATACFLEDCRGYTRKDNVSQTGGQRRLHVQCCPWAVHEKTNPRPRPLPGKRLVNAQNGQITCVDCPETSPVLVKSSNTCVRCP